MRILYDHQIFSIQRYGGISRYFTELYRALQSSSEIQAEISVRYSDNQYVRSLGTPKIRTLLTRKDFRGKGTLQRTLNERHTRRLLERERFDLLHPTFYFDYFRREFPKQKYVITIVDMMDELFPRENDRLQQWIISTKRTLAQGAAAILTISESSKRDIVRLWKIHESDVYVTYLSGGEGFHRDTTPALPLPTRYLLFIGLRGWYKNFLTFARAIAGIMRDSPDLWLVCAGGGPFLAEERKLLGSLGYGERVVQRNVNESELIALYSRAEAFVFPSRYEGFGIPVLEAFACGCPLAASNVSSLPEVAGDAATYFNPDDAESIEAAVAGLIADSDLRSELQRRGFEQLRKFSWKHCAKETMEVYRKAVQK